MTDSLQKAIDVIVRVAQPDRIILFGSRAKGVPAADSDYDLLVLKRNVPKPRALSQQIYLSFKNIGAPVDVIVADLDNYERLKEDPHLVYHAAARDGVVVYEK
ncbi:nucleotidyltransferase-like protein [Hydrogenispora ethanolica]|jgi:predicted nucleotidyltransferase|uniref:Nucleotidyltransferase-like protein n=1 Tax=Hydrogenispora ethanolica TaxID=1082276 RepID=A0A4R1RK20_HYDET|nr:nucleotidyltransferase domain-containing protein [Hydrogenispora ethanolica]TCL66523.1 nucleotidyltransferase-like protein [Hydrogenispora ethanolica]